jgi:hypothetical protein
MDQSISRISANRRLQMISRRHGINLPQRLQTLGIFPHSAGRRPCRRRCRRSADPKSGAQLGAKARCQIEQPLRGAFINDGRQAVASPGVEQSEIDPHLAIRARARHHVRAEHKRVGSEIAPRQTQQLHLIRPFR